MEFSQILPAALVFVLLAACGGTEEITNVTNATGQQNETVPGNETVQQNETLPENATVDEVWESITEKNVETACFDAAKEEAGSDAWAVRGCSCTATEYTDWKYYDCEINTFDPSAEYFMKATCVLAERVCTIESNYGTQNMTFDELKERYS